jgi:hypothetical protein
MLLKRAEIEKLSANSKIFNIFIIFSSKPAVYRLFMKPIKMDLKKARG